MGFAALLVIAVALALDAFAVSACTGCTIGRARWGHYLRMAGAFGVFQFVMSVIGWYLGGTVRGFIDAWDHWIAFVLLAWVGGAMIREGLSKKDAPTACAVPSAGPDVSPDAASATPDTTIKAAPAALAADPTRGRTLLVLAVATSIDALAVGLSFSLINVDIWAPALLIGVVCAILSAVGLGLGCTLASAATFGNRAALVGGVVLIGIGCKILYEHGVADALLAAV